MHLLASSAQSSDIGSPSSGVWDMVWSMSAIMLLKNVLAASLAIVCAARLPSSSFSLGSSQERLRSAEDGSKGAPEAGRVLETHLARCGPARAPQGGSQVQGSSGRDEMKALYPDGFRFVGCRGEHGGAHERR